MPNAGLKLFSSGWELKKDTWVENNLHHEDMILAVAGMGNPKVWMRFEKKTSEY